MGKTQIQTGQLNARELRIAIVVSRYNPRVCEGLLEGALEQLQKMGLSPEKIPVFQVPGCFELPFLAKELARSKKYDALICLGAVIRGETSHYDYVCMGVTEGLMMAMLDTQIPMAFGVLTTDNESQALARAGKDEHNKGVEAARTAVEMALLKKGL